MIIKLSLLLLLLQHTSCETLQLVIDNLGISWLTPDNLGGHLQPAPLCQLSDVDVNYQISRVLSHTEFGMSTGLFLGDVKAL